jgi:hypothetical protein
MIAKQGQNFWDLVIQETGSIDNAFEMSLLNPDRSVTDVVAIGTDIISSSITRKKIVDQFNELNFPATAEEFPSSGDLSPNIGGIGYMQIETSFIVS